MISDHETRTRTRDESGRGRYRKYRKKRRLAQPARTNRTVEIWVVSIVALGVLGMGISWIVSLAQPGVPAASFLSQPAGDLGGGGTPPVIIIQDNSAKPDLPGK